MTDLDLADVFHTEYRRALPRGHEPDCQEQENAVQQALEAVEHAVRADEREQFVRRITELRDSLNFDELLDRVMQTVKQEVPE